MRTAETGHRDRREVRNRPLRRFLCSLLAVFVLCVAAIPAFASYRPNESGAVYVPNGVTTLGSGSLTKDPSQLLKIRSVSVPESVTSIGAGTFVGYPNLRTVTIHNSKDNVKVASGAFGSQVQVVYTGATVKTTAPQKSVPAATRPHSNNPSSPKRTTASPKGKSGNPSSSQKGEKKNVSDTAAETVTETTAADTYEPMFVYPDEDSVNENSRRHDPGVPTLHIVTYAAVGAAAVLAGVLVWIKFRKD